MYGQNERNLETHPKIDSAQLFEIRETVKEITVPKYVEVESAPSAKPRLFADRFDDELLGCGVPPEWLEDVRDADEDSLFDIASHLPKEAAEALFELATGGTPEIAKTYYVASPDRRGCRVSILHQITALSSQAKKRLNRFLPAPAGAKRHLARDLVLNQNPPG